MLVVYVVDSVVGLVIVTIRLARRARFLGLRDLILYATGGAVVVGHTRWRGLDRRGRQLWLMLVLLLGISLGTSATEHYLRLAEAGWPYAPWMDGGRHQVAGWFARTIETAGGQPEAFAAVFITALMAFNETLATALRHVWRPPAEAAGEVSPSLSAGG